MKLEITATIHHYEHDNCVVMRKLAEIEKKLDDLEITPRQAKALKEDFQQQIDKLKDIATPK